MTYVVQNKYCGWMYIDLFFFKLAFSSPQCPTGNSAEAAAAAEQQPEFRCHNHQRQRHPRGGRHGQRRRGRHRLRLRRKAASASRVQGPPRFYAAPGHGLHVGEAQPPGDQPRAQEDRGAAAAGEPDGKWRLYFFCAEFISWIAIVRDVLRRMLE